jgi:hypothetical protein
MAKVLRLDLGEPLASALDDFCKAKHRKKTQLIRELLSNFLEEQLEDPDTKRRIDAAAEIRRAKE